MILLGRSAFDLLSAEFYSDICSFKQMILSRNCFHVFFSLCDKVLRKRCSIYSLCAASLKVRFCPSNAILFLLFRCTANSDVANSNAKESDAE